MTGEICSDNRFELIEKYKKDLFEHTNIQTSKGELDVLDSILFRCWQMGWLDKLEEYDRQKAEIERLDALWNSAQDNNFNILALLHKMRKELKTAKEDNERHKAEVKWWRSQIRDTEDLLAEFDRPIVEVRTEAIKEFAKILKTKKQWDVDIPDYVFVTTIDALVNQMTEVEK